MVDDLGGGEPQHAPSSSVEVRLALRVAGPTSLLTSTTPVDLDDEPMLLTGEPHGLSGHQGLSSEPCAERGVS